VLRPVGSSMAEQFITSAALSPEFISAKPSYASMSSLAAVAAGALLGGCAASAYWTRRPYRGGAAAGSPTQLPLERVPGTAEAGLLRHVVMFRFVPGAAKAAVEE
jgi:hypothetical protein